MDFSLVFFSALILMISHPTQGQTPESVACAADLLKIDYVSPVNGVRRVFCTLRNTGNKIIQHGEEQVFNREGQFLSKRQFENGVDVTNKSNNNTTSQSLAKSPSALPDDIAMAIKQLLSVLVRQKILHETAFNASLCDPDPRPWVKMALTKKPHLFTYTFGEKCDVDGSFTAALNREFPIQFKLRNLGQYINTTMQAHLTISPMPLAIRSTFKISHGILRSLKNEEVKFTAEYSIDLDPISGNARLQTQAGTIYVTSINGQSVQFQDRLAY